MKTTSIKGSLIVNYFKGRLLASRLSRTRPFIAKLLTPAFLLLLIFTVPAYGEQNGTGAASDEETASLSEQLAGIEDKVNPAAWNIRGGCVPLKRIKRIQFLDDQTALMSMRNRNPDRKKIILKLRRECPGIKRNGYIHRTAGLRLCAGFDRFVVMGSSGYACRIESLEPYVSIEEPKPDRDLD